MFVRLSKCCMPVPGDEIIGFMTRGRGVSVHRTDCPSAEGFSSRPDRVVEVEWDNDASGAYVVSVEVEALDRSRLLRDVAHTLAEHHVNILSCPARRRPTAWRGSASSSSSPTPVTSIRSWPRSSGSTRCTTPPGSCPAPRAPSAEQPRAPRERSAELGIDLAVSRDDLFRAPEGGPRRPAARIRALDGDRRALRRAGPPVRLRPRDHADVRAHRGLPAGRRAHRRRRARRCTSSPTRAAAGSGCGPRAPRRSCAAYVQHRPTPPWKVWYVAPNFRYERAQKGRYRQHWQLGVEALGVDDPDIDVEVIALLAGFYRDLGLTGRAAAPQLDGRRRDPARVRRRAAGALRRARRGARRRSSSNGSRRTRCGCSTRRSRTWQDVIESAPQLTEHLSDAAAAQFEAVQAGLRALGVDVRARAAPRARLRLLHAHHVRVPERRARRGAERGRRRRSLRRAGRGDGRAAHARHRLRHRARAHRARARGRAACPRPRAGVDVFVVDGLGGDGGTTVGGLVEALRDARASRSTARTAAGR